MSARGEFRGRGRGRGGSNTRGDSRGKNWSTTLPSSLENKLIKTGALKANYASRGRGGRKERRKDDRQEAKLRKQAYFGGNKQQDESSEKAKDVKGKRKQREEPDLSGNEEVEKPAPKKKAKKQQTAAVENDKPARSKKITADAQTPLSRLLAKQGGSNTQASTSDRPKASGSKSAVEDQEDQEIAWLEYTLGVGKKNSKHLTSEMQEDGLDGLLAPLLSWTQTDGSRRSLRRH